MGAVAFASVGVRGEAAGELAGRGVPTRKGRAGPPLLGGSVHWAPLAGRWCLQVEDGVDDFRHGVLTRALRRAGAADRALDVVGDAGVAQGGEHRGCKWDLVDSSVGKQRGELAAESRRMTGGLSQHTTRGMHCAEINISVSQSMV